MELATGLALWGAGLSSVLGLLRVVEWNDGRRRRHREEERVRSRGKLSVGSIHCAGRDSWGLGIEFRNTGEVDIPDPTAVIRIQQTRDPIRTNPASPEPDPHMFPSTISLEKEVDVLHPGESHKWELFSGILDRLPADLDKTHRVWVQVESRGKVVTRLEHYSVMSAVRSMRQDDGTIPISVLTSPPKVTPISGGKYNETSSQSGIPSSED